jgi:hypothetical protein
MQTLKYFDCFVVFFALLIADSFVSLAAILVDFVLFKTVSTLGFAYASIISIVCFFASVARRFNSLSIELNRLSILFDCLIIFAAGVMLFGVYGQPVFTVETVTSPYLSYAATVLFFMGAGYAAADLFFKLTRRM